MAISRCAGPGKAKLMQRQSRFAAADLIDDQSDVNARCECGHLAFVHRGDGGECMNTQCRCTRSTARTESGARWR